ncbi:hypothetical protein DERF_008695 [Dermatophagoides farinae]|uniref:Uncharacterized protein n=1 Tax=Dermatophagoides farinae TaxID=6954 RepID=A0A922L4K5_DERFA|nr:hypothetical protein DERF_008695 [Dermatophagoides farinae]
MNGENNKYRTDRYEEQKINGDILIRITVMIDLTKKKLIYPIDIYRYCRISYYDDDDDDDVL